MLKNYTNYEIDFVLVTGFSGKKSLPTKDLSPESFEYKRRGLLRVGRAINPKLEKQIKQIFRNDGHPIQSTLDLLVDEVFNYYTSSNLLPMDAHSIVAKLAFGKFATWSVSGIRGKLNFLIEVRSWQNTLNLLRRGINSPYYPDEQAVIRLMKLGMVGRVFDRLQQMKPGQRTQSLMWFDAFRLARSEREAWNILKMIKNPEYWRIAKLKGVDVRRASKLGHEGRIALVSYLEDTTDEYCYCRPGTQTLDWQAFKGYWDSHKSGILGRCATGYLERMWEHGMEYQIAYLKNDGRNLGLVVLHILKDYPATRDNSLVKRASQESAEKTIFALKWLESFNRLPKPESFAIPVELIPRLKQNQKHFVRALREFTNHLNRADAILNAAKTVAHFGGQWRQWLEQTARQHRLTEYEMYHDIPQILPDEFDPELTKFLFKFKGMDLTELRIISGAWYILEPEQKRSFSVARDAAFGLKYQNVKIPKVAFAAAECKLSQKKFEQYQKFFLRKFKVKNYSEIPGVVVHHNNLTFRRLDDEDPRGMMLGVFTNCCQHLDGAGETCAIHGTLDPKGAFFVS